MRIPGLAASTCIMIAALVQPACADHKHSTHKHRHHRQSLAGPARQKPDPALYPGIIGSDDRKTVNAGTGVWRALGQVNIAGYRQRGACSGTLIGERLVLTASHCVMDPAKGTPYPAQHIHFSAGTHGGKAAAHAVASCVKLPPGHAYTPYGKLLPDLPYQRASLESLRGAVAVIVLKDPITAVTPLAVATGPLSDGAAVTHAGYSADKRFVLSVHEGCKTLRRESGLIASDCDTHAGAAGGPLLTGEPPAIAGVLVGMMAKQASLFVPMADWPDAAKDAACP